MCGRHLVKHGVALLDPAPSPGRVRHAGAWTARHQRLHAEVLAARGDGGRHHGGDDVILGGTSTHGAETGPHAGVDVGGGLADGGDLGQRLDGAQLLDEAGTIAQRAEAGEQRLVDGDRQEPAAFVDGDAFALPAQALDEVHGEADGIGPVRIRVDVGKEGIGHHVVELELPHNEVRLGIDWEQQDLEGVVPRRLLASQVEDVLGAGDDEDVYAGVDELLARGSYTGVELSLAESRLDALLHDGSRAAHALISQSVWRLWVPIWTPRPAARSMRMVPLA